MREALLGKIYGIPIALLLVLLFSGTALAWFWFATISSGTTVTSAPLSVENENEFSPTMYPGNTNTWSFDIVNSTDNDYTVRADLTYEASPRITVTEFMVGDADETDDLTDGSAEFEIAAGETLSCKLTITAAEDATSLEGASAIFNLSAE